MQHYTWFSLSFRGWIKLNGSLCQSQEEKGLGRDVFKRERHLFGEDSQNRRAAVHMDFTSFQVLIPILSAIAHFDFMPETATGSIIFPYMSLHKNAYEFKFYFYIYTPGTENMSLLSTNRNVATVCNKCSWTSSIFSNKIGFADVHALFWN